MAKPVTEQELSASLKSVGGFGGLTGRRVIDSPFRDSRAEVKTVDVPLKIESPREVKEEPSLPPALSDRHVETVTTVQPKAETVRKPRPKEKKGQRKADIYTENVTIPMSPEMRDEVDELARQLQRSRTSKDERITANTVMRVAIRHLLTIYDPKLGPTPNDEEELFEAMGRPAKP